MTDRVPAGHHRILRREITFESAAAACLAFEQHNDMPSADFYRFYRKGEWVGSTSGFAASLWASWWEIYLELRPEPEASFLSFDAPLDAPNEQLVGA